MTETCLNCGSIDTEEVDVELSIARGQATLPVHSFGKVVICLECGSAECLVSEATLAQLKEHARNCEDCSN